MNDGQIKMLYERYSCKEAASKAGVSVPTFLKMVDRIGIPRKGSGRPYKKEYESNDPLYFSTEIGEHIFDGTQSRGRAFVFFMFLLMDSRLAANKWDGESNTHICNQFKGTSREENISHLETLKELGLIERYSIDKTGFLSVTIKNRERFVQTEDEYFAEIRKEGK